MSEAALICVGNELLSGVKVNSNMAFLGRELKEMGLPISYAAVIGDRQELIVQTLQDCLENYDIVIITGGLGPTGDDVTKESVALCLGKKLVFDDEIWRNIKQRFSRRGITVPDSNRSQAEVPEGFQVIKNELGTAPGLFTEHNGVSIFLLPGVPTEMEGIFVSVIKPFLRERYRSRSLITRTIRTIDIPESGLADITADIAVPENVDLTFISEPGRVDLVLSGTETNELTQLFEELKERCSEHIWGFDNETLPEIILSLMKKENLTLSVAESCTGGLIQKMLTDIPGASEYFPGGVITYSNRSKSQLLNVSEKTLNRFGAVSSETAKEMAEGVCRLFNTDIGAAVTGIAGPGGYSEDKPVGTVYFAVSYEGETIISKRFFSGGREAVREKTAFFLLNMIRKRVVSREFKQVN